MSKGTNTLVPFIMVGGRLHAEDRLMELDDKSMPPATYVDILSGSTYYPRAMGILKPDANGQPVAKLESIVYVHEQIAMHPDSQTHAMSAFVDILLFRYFHEHGTEIPLGKVEVPQANGLITPGGN